jgi:putative transposase
MPLYRRIFRPGGTYFLTLVTENRAPLFVDAQNRMLLHSALAECGARRPFTIEAIVLLPNHLHLLCTLPQNDLDYSGRVAAVKAYFTRSYLTFGGKEQRSPSRITHRRRGVWQRKFWEHTIKDQNDFNRHMDYIHYNPVKHGLVRCPHAWQHSSFSKWVAAEAYEADWQCVCNSRVMKPPAFSGISCMEFDD